MVDNTCFYGKPAIIYYKPTKLSRKWRRLFSAREFNAEQEKYAKAVLAQEGYATLKVVES